MSFRKSFRIGVSGHRAPPKLPEQSAKPLRKTIDRLLSVIVDTVDPLGIAGAAGRVADSEGQSRPVRQDGTGFVIVSSLAEGSDRIVAEAGLAAGFELEAILPFCRLEYAKDFDTPASQASFEYLLARASTVLELPSTARERPSAYQAAGLLMLSKIDLLIAIWDGRPAAGMGGTAQIVGSALADGIPILWIDPTKPTATQISRPESLSMPTPHVDPSPRGHFYLANDATIALAIKQSLSSAGRGSICAL